MTGADGLNHWRLADELTVTQAALAIVGDHPGADAAKGTQAFKATLTALIHSIEGGRLPAVKVYEGSWSPDFIADTGGTWQPVGSIDVDMTRVMVHDLREWLSTRGIAPAFFAKAQGGTSIPCYLDPTHPRFAPKLAATVHAWEATGGDLLGKTPVSALEKFLRENAVGLGLTRPDGKMNETGIEECAKVANWKTKGGAAKTPGD